MAYLMCNKLLKVTGALSLVSLAALSLANPLQEHGNDGQTMLLYEASPTAKSSAAANQAEWRRRLERMRLAEYGGLSGFSAKTQIQWKSQTQTMLAEAKDLVFPKSFPQELQGWTGRAGQYQWRGQPDWPAPLQLKLTPFPAAQAFQFGNYDELWLDYTATHGIPQCTPQLELREQRRPNGADRPAETVVWRTVGYGSLKSLLRLDETQSDWKEKGYFYLFGRMVGLAPDADWRYAKDQKNTVVQRRMHLKLDAAQMLEIVFAPGYGAERVNLLVSRKDSQGGGELLEFAGLSPNATLPDGRAGVQLDLTAELARRFPEDWAENARQPGRHHFYLQEVILFMPGEQATVVAAKPVRSLAMLGRAVREQGQVQSLTSQIVGINGNQQRMVVDLRKLSGKGRVGLAQAVMELAPPIGEESCALRIDGVRAVSLASAQVPMFAQAAEDWSRRWGGLFERRLPEPGQVEQPGIIAYLPLSTLSRADTEKPANQKYLLTPTQDNRLEFSQIASGGRTPSYRVLGADGQQIARLGQRLLTNGGVTLTVVGPLLETRQEGEMLVVESGQEETVGGQIKISWPLSAQLPDKAWFYWGVAEGAEKIGQAVLTVELAGGRKQFLHIEPNRAVRLPSGAEQVAGMQLTFEPLVYPYRVKMRELALFAPAIIGYDEALALPLPISYDAHPLPLPDGDVALLEARPGYVRGFVGHSPIHFVTPLQQEMAWVRGLRLDFHLPSDVVDGGCPIALRLKWANGETRRQLCPAKFDDQVFIPLANLVGAEGQERDIGALRSIEWIVQGVGTSAAPRGFSLGFAVEGWAMMSALDQLRLSPLFHAGHGPVTMDFAQPGSFMSERDARRFWLPLETRALEKMAQANGEVQPITHSLFSLEKIVAEPKQPMDWRLWEHLVTTPKPYMPQRWPKWLFWISIATIAWVSAYKRCWSPGRAWLYAKGLAYLLYWLVVQGASHLGKGLWRCRSWGNIFVGIMALGPGLWYAGQQTDSYAGLMWLLLALLLAWAAYRHWREWVSPSYAQAMAASKGVRMEEMFLAIALGNVVWAFGHFGMTAQALLGVVPLLGVTYLYLPRIYRLGLVSESRLPGLWRWVGWMTAVVALYGLGLTLTAESGENGFFTFGGMAAVLALRAALLLIEPWLRRLVPSMAEAAFAGAGSMYFSGALVMLVSAAMMLILKLEPIAEQFAIVVYYCLVVGTVKEILALRREHQSDQKAQSS